MVACPGRVGIAVDRAPTLAPGPLAPWRTPRDLILAVAVVAAATAVFAGSVSDGALTVLGALALVVAAVPVLRRRHWHPAEPWLWVLLLVFSGVTMKLAWVAIVGTDSPKIAYRLLNGHDPSVLLAGVIAVIIAMAALGLGYIIGFGPVSLRRFPVIYKERWSPGAAAIVCGAATAIALLGFALFVLDTGGLTATLSGKRFGDLQGGTHARLESSRFLWFRLALLAKFPFYVLLAMRLRAGRLPFLLRAILVVSGTLAVAVPFYANNRAGIVLFLIDIAFISFLLTGRVDRRKLFALGGTALLFMLVLLAWRSTADLSVLAGIERTLFGRDAFDVSVTGQIVSYQPTAWLNGQTLVGWIVAPLPDSLLPTKPLWMEFGPYVAQDIIGLGGSVGVPPKIIGELYLNFRWPGVIIGCFLLGGVFRSLWRTFAPLLHLPNAAIIYTIVLTRFTIYTMTNNFGWGVSKTLLDLVPLLLLLAVVSRVEHRSAARSYPVGFQA